MRIIIHADDPLIASYGLRAVETSIVENYESCGYRYGKPEAASVFVYRNKTGWTARVVRS